jgi:hypothetical protein
MVVDHVRQQFTFVLAVTDETRRLSLRQNLCGELGNASRRPGRVQLGDGVAERARAFGVVVPGL